MPFRPLASVALLAFLAGCAGFEQPPRDEYCTAIFQDLDRAEQFGGDLSRLDDDDGPLLAPDVSREITRLWQNRCVTLSRDLAPLEALGAELAGFRPTDSGVPIRPIPVHVGVLTSIADEARVTAFFRGLGYDSRGQGSAGLGRRIYIGPFSSQGAVDEAIAIARRAGFIAPYAPRFTRF